MQPIQTKIAQVMRIAAAASEQGSRPQSYSRQNFKIFSLRNAFWVKVWTQNALRWLNIRATWSLMGKLINCITHLICIIEANGGHVAEC